MRKHIIFLLIVLLTSLSMLSAQEDDDLFGGDDMVAETPAETRKMFSVSDVDIFNGDTVRIGGSLASSLKTIVQWKEDDNGAFPYNSTSMAPDLRGAFFIDARPSTNLRIYSKFNYAFPFKLSTSAVDVPAVPPVFPGFQFPSLDIPQFNVFELFTDFSLGESVFFRFGKHTVKWGVGYFFSPVDVLNLSVIDPEEPETQREGPVSLRVQFVFPNTQNALYLYALPDTNPPSGTQPFQAENTAAAAKFELVAGNSELGFGAWYKHLRSPRFIMTYSGTIAGKVGAFGEGLFAWGKDNEWIDKKNPGGMGPVFQATAGLSYSNTDINLSISGQYFYNGFGETNPAVPSIPGSLTLTNLSGYGGQHYAAASISLSELFTPKLSASLFGMFGIDSVSGTTNFLISWRFLDELSLSAGPMFTYGKEYTRDGKPVIGLQITAKLGGGRF